MDLCAAMIFGGTSAAQPILFKPALLWVLEAVRDCKIEDLTVLTANTEVRALAENAGADCLAPESDADNICTAALRVFAQPHDILLLRGDMPLMHELFICAAYDAHQKNENDMTAFCCPREGGALLAAWVRRSALESAAANAPLTSDGCPLARLSEILQKAGGKVQTLEAPFPEAALCADTARSRNTITAYARRNILEALLDAGVEIPSMDGVLVGPDVTVQAGATLLPGTILRGHTTVGAGSVLGPNTLIEDSEIGENAVLNSTQCYRSRVLGGVNIGPFVHIRPNSVVGENVHLDNFVEIKNSNIDTGTKVSHLTYVGDSDVGKRVNFGCGTVTVNYTGKAKFRTTIGDDAFIGCNTNLVAPVKVGDGAYTAAGSTITENVPADALGIARARQVNKEGWSRRFLSDKK